jgi:hypothetical protein
VELAGMAARGSLWACPRCGRRFAQRNQAHSCTTLTLAEHLRGHSADAVALYRAFEAAVRECGPVRIHPAKTRIGFITRMTFAAVSLRRASLDAHVILARRLEHPRFYVIESFRPRCHRHAFRISASEQVDADVRAWLREAYRVGLQERDDA